MEGTIQTQADMSEVFCSYFWFILLFGKIGRRETEDE